MSASATHGGLNNFPTRLNVAHVFCASDFMLKYWLRNNVIRWVFRLTHIGLLFEVVSVRPSVRTSTKSFFWFPRNFGVWVDLDHICTPVWPRPDLRSRSGSRSFRSCEKCTSLRLSPPPFLHGAQKWWLAVIVRDLDYSLSEPDFWISFRESYHKSSNFALCPYFTIFQWPYFGSPWRYSHMVGRATSSTRTVYIAVTLTRSKVKVKVTGLLNFRQLAKPCILAAMTAAPLRRFLVVNLST